jgi:hypothetical protein
MARSPRIQFLFQPARALGRAGAERLAGELREVAGRARPELDPPAACQPGALADRVLVLARESSGGLCGFASARLLPVRGLGEALHLEAIRATGPERDSLPARLATALVGGYCVRFCFPARLWCVFDGSGPGRLGEAIDSERALSTSCAVDEVARRLTRAQAPGSERWSAWLAGALTPVVSFELGGRLLETGYVSAGALLARALRRRLSRSASTRAPTPVPRAAA